MKTRIQAGVYHVNIDDAHFIVKHKQNEWRVFLCFTSTHIAPVPVLYARTLKASISKIERFAVGYNARHTKRSKK